MLSSYALTHYRRGTKISTIWRKKQQRNLHHLTAANRFWKHKHLPQNLHACEKHKLLLFATKFSKERGEVEEPPSNGIEPKGTVAGAVALIIGTSIGSGILALPKKTAPAGFVPTSISMVVCWGFLLVEALLLAEINVELMKKKKNLGKVEADIELEFISLRSMAQETLGEVGGSFATINYIFLSYSSMAAYTAKSGDILSTLFHLPTSIAKALFALSCTALISIGGASVTDRVNQWMTACMMGLLIAIEALGAAAGNWSGLTTWNWGRVPETIPVIIFSLVYHDISPVICSYLGGDLPRIRLSIVIGSLVPLLALLIWDAVALGMVSFSGATDPLDQLARVGSSEVLAMVEAFSLLAVGTSMIGSILGFSEFLIEQFRKRSSNLPIDRFRKKTIPRTCYMNLREWWEICKINLTAGALVIGPPLLVLNSVPDAFYTATDISVSHSTCPDIVYQLLFYTIELTFQLGGHDLGQGGYCMALLFGVLPPAMARSMYHSPRKDDEEKKLGNEEVGGGVALLICKPVLLMAGLFASGIVLDQIMQDISLLLS